MDHNKLWKILKDLGIPDYLTCLLRNLFSLHCLDFQAEDRLTPRWHVGQPCGKVSWESLVGSLEGKPLIP